MLETKLQELVVGLGIPAERDSGGSDTRVEEAEEKLQQLQRQYDQCEKLARTLLEERREKEEQEQNAKSEVQLQEKEELGGTLRELQRRQ